MRFSTLTNFSSFFFRCSVLAFEFSIKSIHDCNILVICFHLRRRKQSKGTSFQSKTIVTFIVSVFVAISFQIRCDYVDFHFAPYFCHAHFTTHRTKKNKKRMKLQVEMPVDEDMLIWRQITFYFNVRIKVVCKRKHFPLSLLWMTGRVTLVYELVYQNDDFRLYFGLDKHSKNRNKKIYCI